MRSVKEELRRNFALYAVFHVAGGMLILVNKLEGTFARTLVGCDVLVASASGAPFSGSAHCGDRLFVIDQGQKLSSAAQGHECLCKVLAMVFVSVMADVIGRKPSIVMGISCTALSTVLFVVASMSPLTVASWLFTLGQALQGAFPAELLGSIVVTDTGNEPGASLITISTINQVLSTAVNLAMECLAASVTSLELLDFRPVWAVVALINILAALAAVTCCRETKPDFGKPSGSLLEGVRHELGEYSQLVRNSFLLRMNLLMFAFFSIAKVCDTLDFSFVISRHSFSQARAVLWFFFQPPVAIVFIGMVADLSKKFGEKRTFVALASLLVLLDLVFLPFYPASPWAIFMHKYSLCVFSGIGPMIYAVDSRWFDQRVTAKFLAMKNLVTYGVGMAANPVYAALFDAKAEDYFSCLKPYLIKLGCRCVQAFILFGICWDVGAEGGLSKVLDTIERENSEARAAEAEARRAAEGKKQE